MNRCRKMMTRIATTGAKSIEPANSGVSAQTGEGPGSVTA